MIISFRSSVTLPNLIIKILIKFCADLLEKELVKEGEKLSDLLSIPVKDALGREVPVNYQEDIINVQEILDMTAARKQLFKDSIELQRLTLQQVIHIRNYEKHASQVMRHPVSEFEKSKTTFSSLLQSNELLQAVDWLDELYKVMLKSHSHIGCSVYEIQIQKEEQQCFQETAKVNNTLFFMLKRIIGVDVVALYENKKK